MVDPVSTAAAAVGIAEKVLPHIRACIEAIGLPSFLCFEDRQSSLRQAVEDLRDLERKIKLEVAAETNRLKDCPPEVERWLNRAAELLEETKRFVEETDEETEGSELARCRCLCACSANLLRRCRLCHPIAGKLQEVNKLIDAGKRLETAGREPEPGLVEPRPRMQTFGMEGMLKELRGYFDDDERRIIAVCGQGGIGKTTLLNELNNELKGRAGDFHVVIMLTVSTNSIADIQRKISDRLALPWKEGEEEEARANFLAKVLGRKKFVILLDDVREKILLKDMGIPIPDATNSSKIVLASRNKQVCCEMGAQRSLIMMKLLDDEASRNLFRSKLSDEAIDAINHKKNVETYADAIVQSCDGLPLALNVIGTAVAGLMAEGEWGYVVKATKSKPQKIDGVNEMFHQLKYSYDRLDRTLQQCFLYCTLYSDHDSIKRDQLVDYWMAEGLIHNNAGRGHHIIGRLISACLLQSGDSESDVKMHNIVRQFGLSLAKQEGKFLVKAGKGLKEAPAADQWKKATRISLMSNKIKNLDISPDCNDLLTLLLQKNSKLEKLGPKFFIFMPNLRVLDLSHTAITELPECDKLVSLQYLNLAYTRITELPQKLRVLQALRHLDLSATTALKNTNDNCSKLLRLRVLNLFRSEYGINDVNDLNLDGLSMLWFLGITIYKEDVLKKLKKKHPLAKSTHRLSLKYCEGMSSIQGSSFEHMKHLEEIYIESCDGLKELIADADAGSTTQLQVLTLAVLSNLERISVGPAPHHFQSLRDLTIVRCHKLDNISWVLWLESLERLVISHCYGMEYIVQEASTETQTMNGVSTSQQNEIEEAVTDMGADSVIQSSEFPKLRSVILNDLPKLQSICCARNFSCLESIRVEGCKNLKRLPISRTYRIEKLKQICGSDEWWRTIDWEDENMRAGMHDYFIPI
ncbi:Disease resistance protein RPS2 [Ananas comosus]|uniref:Disease resistance protein RPS2 n=1 Tax=Ananas comosus TaxID=4615 RepID=A0A199W9E3_ANACO|nr:Disease resistance protein RPS2 [Ananas comosus]